MASRAATLLLLKSNCDYEFTGTFEDDRYIYEYPEGMNEGNLSVFWAGEEMFFGAVTLQPDTGNAVFQINILKYAQVMKTDKTIIGAQPQMDEIPVIIPLYFEAEMDMAGKISAGEQAMPYSYSWPDIEPKFPPTEETAR